MYTETEYRNSRLRYLALSYKIQDFIRPILGPARAYKDVSKMHHRSRYRPNRDVWDLGRRVIYFQALGEKDHLYSGIWGSNQTFLDF